MFACNVCMFSIRAIDDVQFIVNRQLQYWKKNEFTYLACRETVYYQIFVESLMTV